MTARQPAPNIPRLPKNRPNATLENLYALIGPDMKAVDAVIRSELASDVPRMKEISEYITSAGGKRMRPALLMLICRALGYEGTLVE